MKFSSFYLLSSLLLLLLLVSCSEDESNGLFSRMTPEFAMAHAPSVTLANQNAYRIEGTCTKKGEVVTVSVASLNPQTGTCSEELKWQVTVDVSPVDAGDFVPITAEESGKSITREVKRDTTRPEVAIGSSNPVVNSINQENYNLRGTCDEEDGEVVLDVGGVSAMAICDGANWVANGIDLSGLAAEVARVRVTADLADALGNLAAQASLNLHRDVIPPQVGITSPSVINRNSIDDSSSYVLEGTCEYNGPGVVTVNMPGLSAREVDCESGGWRLELSASELQGLPEQNGIAISVEHRDEAENVGHDETGQVDKDTVAPLLAIITSGLVINAANQGHYALEGTCSEANGNVGIKIGSDAIISIPCDDDGNGDGLWRLTPRNDLLEGSYALAITQEDAAGNTGSITPAPTLIKDVTTPNYAFNSDLDINIANENQYHVSGTCDEEGEITVTVGTLGEKTATCQGSIWRTAFFDTSSIATGTSLILSAVARDRAGNQQTGLSKTVSKDTSVHTVQITLPTGSLMAAPINVANAAAYPVSGICNSKEGAVTVTVGTSPTTVSATSDADDCSSDGQWSVSVNVGNTISDGPSVAIVASFGSGDGVDTDATTALKDTVVPSLTITPPLINSHNQNSYSFEGTCPGIDGAVDITVGTLSIQEECMEDAWKVEGLDVGSLTGSSVTITLDGEDGAGNPAVQQSSTVGRDVEAPEVAIVSADDITIANKGSYSLSGTCSDEGANNVEVSIANAPGVTVSCSSQSWMFPPTVSDIPDGNSIAVAVVHRDALDNEKTVRDEINKDTVRPVLSIDEPEEVTPANLAAYPLSGDCTKGDGAVTVSVETVSPDPQPDCDGSPGRWNTTVDLGPLGGGSRPITASQTDALGNIGNAPEKSLTIPGFRTFLLETISAGYGHMCALKSNGTVNCWGNGSYGRLGNGLNGPTNYPVGVISGQGSSDLLSSIVQVSVGGYHTCALKSDGTVNCWGSSYKGELGDGTSTDKNYPVVVISGQNSSHPLSSIIQVSSGGGHTCALKSDGTVSCWGSGDNGRLGDGTTHVKSYPVVVISGQNSSHPLRNIVQVSSGGSHTCTLKSDGTVNCWGSSYNGELGDGTSTDKDYPVVVISGQNSSHPLKDIVQVSSGGGHTCALKSDGTVSCWGNGSNGQLGDGTSTSKNYPVGVISGQDSSDLLSSIVQVSSGGGHTCALKSDGTVSCWGNGNYGELGDGTSTSKNYPVGVILGEGNSASLNNVVQISSQGAASHTCAQVLTGELKCWGDGFNGTLGNGDNSEKNYPVTVIVDGSTSEFLNMGTYRKSYVCNLLNSSCSLSNIELALGEDTSSPGNSDAAPDIDVSKIGSGETFNLYSNDSCETQVGDALTADGTVRTSDLSEGIHRFYFTVAGGGHPSDCSRNFLAYIYDTSNPTTPTLELVGETTGTSNTPNVRVSGVTPGELINIYRDSTCLAQAASPTRVDGISAEITVSELSGAGPHSFYAKATDTAGNESACSTATDGYTLTEESS